MTQSNLTGAEQIQWNLSDLYISIDDEQLTADQQKLKDLARQFAEKYRGEVASLNAADFKEALKTYEKILDLAGKLGSYAQLIWSTNTNKPEYGKLMQHIQELSSQIHQELVFFDVEWLQTDDAKAQRFIENDALSHYKHYLETSRRYKEHVLSEAEEKILSAKSVTGRAAWNRFFNETLSAARFDIDGEKLTEQQALSQLHKSSRNTRKKAHGALTETFRKMSRTTTYIFNTILADKQTDDRLRHYKSWISSRNLANEIDDETVDTLVNAVVENYGLVHRFYRLKKRLLGCDTLYDYDRYAPLLKNKKQIDWDEARETVLTSYSNFHPEMGAIATKFFNEKWIDAAIQPGKRGGAYSAGTVPSVHPYVFMNYDGQVRDVQTLAHELGHGVHQYLSREQGVLQASTPLTTAETASVFGEMLTFQNLMRRLDEPKEKLALLIGKIDDTIATVFRQVSMNRFEDTIHTKRRSDGELSTETFSELWLQTQHEIYGDSVEITEEYGIWWSYIPHFLHTPGYVYAYAFGELLVLALYEAYTKQQNGFSEKYVQMLKAGGSEWPEDIVAKAGLDITRPDFWNGGLAAIKNMIEEAEDLADKI